MQHQLYISRGDALALAAVLVEVGDDREGLMTAGAVGVLQAPPTGGAAPARVHDPNYTLAELHVNFSLSKVSS